MTNEYEVTFRVRGKDHMDAVQEVFTRLYAGGDPDAIKQLPSKLNGITDRPVDPEWIHMEEPPLGWDADSPEGVNASLQFAARNWTQNQNGGDPANEL